MYMNTETAIMCSPIKPIFKRRSNKSCPITDASKCH